MNDYLTDPLALAVLFHVTYERLAPQKGYETRTETRIFDPESPNGKLMIATCAAIQAAIRDEEAEVGVKEKKLPLAIEALEYVLPLLEDTYYALGPRIEKVKVALAAIKPLEGK